MAGILNIRKSAARVRREEPDGIVTRIMTKDLVDRAFLQSVFDAHEATRTEAPGKGARLAAQKEKLEARRRRLVDLAVDGMISREDFATRSRDLDRQLRN